MNVAGACDVMNAGGGKLGRETAGGKGGGGGGGGGTKEGAGRLSGSGAGNISSRVQLTDSPADVVDEDSIAMTT